MAHTIRSDLIVPEVLEDAIRGEFEKVQALYGSGAGFVTARGWPGAKGGDRVTVPYFGTIGEFEDLDSDEDNSGALPALTPAKLAMTDEDALVAHSGKAFETSQWARIAAAYADPYAEAARQMRVGLERLIDSKLLAAARAASGILSHSVYSNSSPVYPTWDGILEARFKWGDEQDDIALMVMHSAVALRLLKEKGDGLPVWNEVLKTGALPASVLGIPVKISDKALITLNAGGADTASSYETLLIKQGALAFWFSGGEPEVQTDRDILADSTVAAIHVYYAAHRYKRLAGSSKVGVVRYVHN